MHNSKKKLMVGVIGIGGCGKTTFMRALMNSDYYKKGGCYCTEVTKTDIKYCNPPTIQKFFTHGEKKKRDFHKRGLEWLRDDIRNKGNKNVVFMTHYSYTFRNENNFYIIMDPMERDFYDIIIYLDFDPKVIHQRQSKDSKRKRNLSLSKVTQWSKFEKRGVLEFFKNTKIVNMNENSRILSYVIKLLEDHDAQ